jgi:trimeric autotransporter adhesin
MAQGGDAGARKKPRVGNAPLPPSESPQVSVPDMRDAYLRIAAHLRHDNLNRGDPAAAASSSSSASSSASSSSSSSAHARPQWLAGTIETLACRFEDEARVDKKSLLHPALAVYDARFVAETLTTVLANMGENAAAEFVRGGDPSPYCKSVHSPEGSVQRNVIYGLHSPLRRSVGGSGGAGAAAADAGRGGGGGGGGGGSSEMEATAAAGAQLPSASSSATADDAEKEDHDLSVFEAFRTFVEDDDFSLGDAPPDAPAAAAAAPGLPQWEAFLDRVRANASTAVLAPYMEAYDFFAAWYCGQTSQKSEERFGQHDNGGVDSVRILTSSPGSGAVLLVEEESVAECVEIAKGRGLPLVDVRQVPLTSQVLNICEAAAVICMRAWKFSGGLNTMAIAATAGGAQWAPPALRISAAAMHEAWRRAWADAFARSRQTGAAAVRPSREAVAAHRRTVRNTPIGEANFVPAELISPGLAADKRATVGSVSSGYAQAGGHARWDSMSEGERKALQEEATRAAWETLRKPEARAARLVAWQATRGASGFVKSRGGFALASSVRAGQTGADTAKKNGKPGGLGVEEKAVLGAGTFVDGDGKEFGVPWCAVGDKGIKNDLGDAIRAIWVRGAGGGVGAAAAAAAAAASSSASSSAAASASASATASSTGSCAASAIG